MRYPKLLTFALGLAIAAAAGAQAQYDRDDNDGDTAGESTRAVARGSARSASSHLTAVEGGGSVLSEANGRSDARVHLPLQAGDQIAARSGGRMEIALAGGNRDQLAAESQVRLDALAGENDSASPESALTLIDGSIAVESVATGSDRPLRVDTPDASIYMPGRARVRVNLDQRRGTSIIVRDGSAEVKMRSGSRTLEAGSYLLVHGDQEPEVAQGSFSRDRFDAWVSERTQSTLEAYNSTAARYIDSDYVADASGMDSYGQWDYNSTYRSNVWRPSVGADWSPYSDGYWYNADSGASWVSYEPWGWFPYHYGNWFFDAGWNSWCWSPAYVYSPAWVYWGYGGGYAGWCPMGYYSYYSPYRNHWGGYGSRRNGLYVSVRGVFNPAQVDFRRGWNFVGVNSIGTTFNRAAMISGQRARTQLGGSIAITSDPLRVPVSGRGGVSAATALRSFIRGAPQTIARQVPSSRSATLAPYLGRQKALPPATVAAIRDNHIARVDPVSASLNGPGSTRLPAARGNLPVVGSRRSANAAPRAETWRAPAAGTSPGRSAVTPRLDAWRGEAGRAPLAPRSEAVRPRTDSKPDWRSRPSAPAPAAPAPRSRMESSDAWRNRTAPPARRVIDGVDRGRAIPRSEEWRQSRSERGTPAPRYESAPRSAPTPRYESAPRSAPTPRYESAPRSAPAPRYESAPRSAPAPRYESAPRSAPAPRYESAPRMESRSAPAPRAESRPAPSGRKDPHR